MRSDNPDVVIGVSGLAGGKSCRPRKQTDSYARWLRQPIGALQGGLISQLRYSCKVYGLSYRKSPRSFRNSSYESAPDNSFGQTLIGH